MPLTEITRTALFDDIVFSPLHWSGRLDEPQFLERLYRLAELPSNDKRFRDAAGDIYQHTVNNDDWEKDWVFYDGRFGLDRDDALFKFLAQTVHPVVRPNKIEAFELVAMYNQHLNPDGYEMVAVSEISGRPIFDVRPTVSIPSAVAHIEQVIQLDDMNSVRRWIRRMDQNIVSDPELAIGSAKELVETVSHIILEGHGVVPERDWDLARLVKEASKLINVTPADVGDDSPAADSIRKVLGSLGGIVSGIAQIRNSYGTGHGRAPRPSGLGPRHARLAVGAASTLAVFLFETYEARRPQI